MKKLFFLVVCGAAVSAYAEQETPLLLSCTKTLRAVTDEHQTQYVMYSLGKRWATMLHLSEQQLSDLAFYFEKLCRYVELKSNQEFMEVMRSYRASCRSCGNACFMGEKQESEQEACYQECLCEQENDFKDWMPLIEEYMQLKHETRVLWQELFGAESDEQATRSAQEMATYLNKEYISHLCHIMVEGVVDGLAEKIADQAGAESEE